MNACPSFIDDPWTPLIAQRVSEQFGAHLTGTRLRLFCEELQHLARQHAPEQPEQWLQSLLQTPWQPEQALDLIATLTVNETYFRRDAAAFDWLEQQFLPTHLSPQRKSLRIWSAGCCTGEEAYSLRFSAELVRRQLGLNTNIEVLGSDLSEPSLAIARTGCYRQRSFRETNESYKTLFFDRLGQQWRVKASYRQQVQFQQHNLNQPTLMPEGSFDLILCRNVLMYFEPSRAQKILAVLIERLSSDGVLLLSASESALLNGSARSGFWAGNNFAIRRQQAAAIAPLATPIAPKRQPFYRPTATGPTATSPPSLDVNFVPAPTPAPTPSAENDPELFVQMALAHWQKQQTEAALADADRALYLQADHPLANVIRAQACLRLRRHKAARSALHNAINALTKLPAGALLPGTSGFGREQMLALCQQWLKDLNA